MRLQFHSYDTIKFNFVKLVEELYGNLNLRELHTQADEDYTDLFKVGNDSCTIFHKKFYDKYHAGWEEFEELYEKFIREVIAPKYPGGFVYQKFPTFRVHLPNNIAVGAFHNDAEFGHPPGEINFIIPLTWSQETASIWLESEPSKKDFRPLAMLPGDLIQFNGNTLTHGNKINLTGKTRVSIDFRILPLEKYNENHLGESVTLKTKFKVGEYYKQFKR